MTAVIERARALPKRRPRRYKFWKGHVKSRVSLLRDQLDALEQCRNEDQRNQPDPTSLEHIRDLLDQAEHAANGVSVPGRTACNDAFQSLHAAEVMLAQRTPEDRIDFAEKCALARLRLTLNPANPQRCAVEESLGKGSLGARQAAVAEALRLTYSTQDEHFARVRSFVGVLWWCIVGLILLGVALVYIGHLDPSNVPLCFKQTTKEGSSGICPSGPLPSGWDVARVGLLGSIGGAVAAVVAIRRMHGTTAPYEIPLALAVLKLPLGAITAIAGLVLIRGAFIPGLSALDDSGQIMAWALLLGYSQQLFTRVVDDQAHKVLTQVDTETDADSARTRQAERQALNVLQESPA